MKAEADRNVNRNADRNVNRNADRNVNRNASGDVNRNASGVVGRNGGMMVEAKEIRLVRQAQKGKKEALETLFLMEKEYLYKIAFLYMKNKEDVLDLVQESIL